MRSAASAIAWEFRQRHRWGLRALVVYLLVLAAIRLFVINPAGRINFSDAESFALVDVVPLTATFMYFLAVFSFGLTGDLAARHSMYPSRMFSLPVTSGALAGWPMLYGAAAMALLWMATRFLAVWPSDVDVPIVWPALLAASLLAWTQALTWTAYPLPGLRVVVTVLWLAVIDAVVMIALQFRAGEMVMLAILSPHVPLAYLVAHRAVRRARVGDVPDWRETFRWLGWLVDVLARRSEPFSSPARAQAWFEWRQHGRSLPVMVAIVLPFELAMLFLFRDTPVIVFETLVSILFTPVFMAAFVAATVSRPNLHASDSLGLPPMIATRPMTSASLIAAKLNVTIRSTLVTWLMVLVALTIALRLSGTSALLIDWMRDLSDVTGTPRAIALVLLGVALCVSSTWKQLVQSLFVGMTGREWLVKASVFVTLSLLAVLGPLLHWIVRSHAAIAALWNGFPVLTTVFVCMKGLVAAWVVVRLHDERLVSERTLIAGAACWSLCVVALYALLVWIAPPLLIRSYALGLVAILAVPLARLSAAPLALARNRHH